MLINVYYISFNFNDEYIYLWNKSLKIEKIIKKL